MKTKMNIGISSLILIFIVLCLVTFGLLSLSSARNDLVLAERNAEAVQEYYRADTEGERFIAMADSRLKKLAADSGMNNFPSVSSEKLKQIMGDYYNENERTIRTDISMERGQALHVELDLEKDSRRGTFCSVRSFYVYNQEDYEIDQSIPVWTGQ
ncbi:hypothetical protein [Clostridium sp. AM58-1XD]|uniref:hypothetical protein n=1 Tax=Clostridium sp. AM58-1XD TaxID=2292307 RepID=UPI000E46B5BB|nr:hypothetical protein [Clostridium sp. AM58-1XD]RGY98405.1 hypothetical protein DXA13_11425 [Clostridium sp. AM58-1XD]